MYLNIIVPTCKKKEPYYMDALEKYLPKNTRVIYTGFSVSAAINRNFGLLCADSEIVIMLDDDMLGFFPGWCEDLIAPLEEDKNTIMVSARLLQPNGQLGIMMDLEVNMKVRLQEVHKKCLPSACIAFRKDDTFFDEEFIGASWEDLDFCVELRKKYPMGKFVIHNGVPLIHVNEQKNQDVYAINKQYFCDKHNIPLEKA